MPIIMVDPDDAGTQTGTILPPPPGFRPTPFRDRLGEPIDPAGDCCVYEGRPCILFGDWDYAEDWSGEFVREIHPFLLIGPPTILREAFWDLVKAGRRS